MLSLLYIQERRKLNNNKTKEALELGIRAHRKGDLKLAQEYYSAVLKIEPNHADANHNLAIISLQNNNLDIAFSYLDLALASNKECEQYWVSYIKALLRSEEFERARDKLVQAKSVLVSRDEINSLMNDLKKFRARSEANNPSNEEIDSLVKLYNLEEYYQALILAENLIAKFPHSSKLYNIAGAIASGQKTYTKAINLYEAALSIAPFSADILSNLGITLQKTGKFQFALKKFEQAITLSPSNVSAWHNKAITHRKLGEFSKAIECLRGAINTDPLFVQSWASLCDLFESNNQIDDLAECINKIEVVFKDPPSELRLYQALLYFRTKKFDQSLSTLELIDEKQLTDKRHVRFLELKGKLYDKKGEYMRAFSAFKQMNQWIKAYDPKWEESANQYFDLVRNQVTNFKCATAEKQFYENNCKNNKVFLIGFPRSGTTLLDTMLRSHSQIEVVEEKPVVEMAKSSLKTDSMEYDYIYAYPSNEDRLKAQGVYENALRSGSRNHDSALVVDKLPLNIFELNFIEFLFPGSKYIIASRHPYDCILSNWMQNYELNPAMSNMLDLERIVDLYCLAMENYFIACEKLDLNSHVVKYENIVGNMHNTLNEVLNFLGLEWEETIFDYQSTALKRDKINTPSYQQVVEPLYQTSAYRWRNYKKFLIDYDVKIQKWIEILGYSERDLEQTSNL